MNRRASLALAGDAPRAARPNGFVVYRGPSLIDGAEIVVILTGLRQACTLRDFLTRSTT